MRVLTLAVLLLSGVVLAQSPAHSPQADCPLGAKRSPYAGEERRAIKALSAEERDQLLAGHGMGLARAAELNHYPGPKHVMELADRLELTAEQIEATRAIFNAMHQEAIELGRRIVEMEAALDASLAAGRIDEATLAESIREIGRLQAELRLAHLRAHLRMKDQMSGTQVARYDELRGYVTR